MSKGDEMKTLLTVLLLTLSMTVTASDSFTGRQYTKQVGFQSMLYCEYRAAFGGTYWQSYPNSLSCPMYSGGY